MSQKPILVIAGASGVIGTHLIKAAGDRYRIRTLTRSSATKHEGATPMVWRPEAAKEGDRRALEALAEGLDGASALVNLAGASVADGRLGEAHKRRVLESRVDSTRTLLHAHRLCPNPPPVWFQASATGYYGDAGEAALNENAPKDAGFFLAEVCDAWERAAGDANGARLVIGRIGVVLAQDAPGWQKMLAPIRLGVGGPFGSGRQWWPWIDADDLVGAMLFLIGHEESRGVYNLSAPEPVRQGDLAREAARRLRRPTIAAPAFALRLATGGVADTVLLPSAKALPAKLLKEGFTFERTNIESELDKLLG